MTTQQIALTSKELNQFTCDVPDCSHDSHELFIHSRCHPEYPTWSIYHDGLLTITCSMCDKVIVVIKVADDV